MSRSWAPPTARNGKRSSSKTAGASPRVSRCSTSSTSENGTDRSSRKSRSNRITLRSTPRFRVLRQSVASSAAGRTGCVSRDPRGRTRHAISTPGDLLFHIRAKRIDLCFELATQIMARLGGPFRRRTRSTAFVTSIPATFWVSSTGRRIDRSGSDRRYSDWRGGSRVVTVTVCQIASRVSGKNRMLDGRSRKLSPPQGADNPRRLQTVAVTWPTGPPVPWSLYRLRFLLRRADIRPTATSSTALASAGQSLR